MNVNAILKAMRADCVKVGESGRWRVRRVKLSAKQAAIQANLAKVGLSEAVPPGIYTYLQCLTMPTMLSGGELVMNDFPSELRKHLEFVMLARWRVLVTGLGLGCVVRGLLARGLVTSVDVVERADDVIKLCGASVADPRVTIHHADARSPFFKGTWDYAWHDLWSDPDRSEPHLQVIHADLMNKFVDQVPRQGAWAFPRKFRRLLANGWLKNSDSAP